MCSRTGGFLTGKLMIITGQLFLPFQSSAVFFNWKGMEPALEQFRFSSDFYFFCGGKNLDFMLSVDCDCIYSCCDACQHQYTRFCELKISTELNLETAKHTYLMMVIFCVHFHRANHQEKLNLTTNGNNGTNGTEHLDLNFYLGIYAGNCTCTCVCI